MHSRHSCSIADFEIGDGSEVWFIDIKMVIYDRSRRIRRGLLMCFIRGLIQSRVTGQKQTNDITLNYKNIRN